MIAIIKSLIIGVGVIAALLALLVTQYEDLGPALGGALPGISASVATSSRIEVGPAVNVELWGSNQGCAARIVSTQAQPIMLAFDDVVISSTTLSQTIGHIQAGSSTVVYDTGLYGCGRWFGYAAASTTITKVETR